MALVAVSGCHKEFPSLASKVKIGDATRASQLLYGFYPPESGNPWCWTARTFSVLLAPPAESERRGARLQLIMHLSPAQIEKLGAMTLEANAGGYKLAPETFEKAGNYVYSVEVPRDALATNLLPVTFVFDKSSPPSDQDARELAVIVSSVGLETN